MTMSGLIFHPSSKATGAGLSFASPSAAPLSAQSLMARISASLNRRSFLKWPYAGSANHGGICRAITAAFIDFAQGRVSANVMKDIGAISPGRWQVWQFFCRIGRTSLLNVTCVTFALFCAVIRIDAVTDAIVIDKATSTLPLDRMFTPIFSRIGPLQNLRWILSYAPTNCLGNSLVLLVCFATRRIGLKT